MSDTSFEETLFETLTDDSDSPGGLDEDAQAVEPGNFLRHAMSLTASKVADGLIDPKLVLSWLLSSLGASALFLGLLVPIREAGALLPQLFVADRIRAMPRRKWFWAAGSLGQGLATAGIVLAGLTLDGNAAGAVICLLVALLAVSRSICSASFKDVLGKTVGKTRRGSVTGLASSFASVGVVVFALLLLSGVAERMVLVIGALTLAAGLWLAAGAVFSTLREMRSPGAAGSGGNPLRQLKLLSEDRQLVVLIVARGLLVSTALAPPYLVLLGQEDGGQAFGRLGALVLASAVASLISSYVWGRLADRSSRNVLRLAGVAGAVAMGGAVVLDLLGQIGTVWALPAVLFVLMVAYHGVRQGRSTYLVDMAPPEARASYTAVSNTVIGVLLLASGAFGALASLMGPDATLCVFAGMSLAAAVVATRLAEVEA
ncbi:MFS transporter [Tranquillimonas rosea]|uniref:MFS transporter n=1 Tax=Tranquillimonas rosea TaxID=641238 RepID=UPI003BAC05ED